MCVGRHVPGLPFSCLGPPLNPGRVGFLIESPEIPTGTLLVLGVAGYPFRFLGSKLEPVPLIRKGSHESELVFGLPIGHKEISRISSGLQGVPRSWLPEAKLSFYRFLPVLTFIQFLRLSDSPFRANSLLLAPVTHLYHLVALRSPLASIWLWTDASDKDWGLT